MDVLFTTYYHVPREYELLQNHANGRLYGD